jgi:hypothetical protein
MRVRPGLTGCYARQTNCTAVSRLLASTRTPPWPKGAEATLRELMDRMGNKRQDSQIVTVTADDHTFQLGIDGQTVATVPRTSGREIHRYQACATQQPRRPR